MNQKLYKYSKIPFDHYFIAVSENYNKKPIPDDIQIPKYQCIRYERKRLFGLFKIKYDINYQIFYDNKRNVIQIFFQGSQSLGDWISNFDFPFKPYDKFTFDNKIISLKIHRGWGDMYFAVQDTIRQRVKHLLEEYPNSEIEIIGFSLGSAIAQICSEDIFFKFKIKPILITFGSVKPFFGRRTYHYVKSCCKEVYNFRDNNDIVGSMVPFFGWKAIRHIKVKHCRFCLLKYLFGVLYYHMHYDDAELYKEVK